MSEALDAYTAAERLPWAELVIRCGRTLARIGRAPADAAVRADRDAALAEARRMQFNEIVSLIVGESRA